MLLHRIPWAATDEISSASKKEKTEKTEEELEEEREMLEQRLEYEQQKEKEYRRTHPDNLRPRFADEALAPPKRELLEYRYAAAILKRYGTHETQVLLDQDWDGPLGDESKDKGEDDGDYRERSDQDDHNSDGQGWMMPHDSPPGTQRPRRSVPRRTAARYNRSGLDQAFDMMYNITHHLYVAPLEAEAELLVSREREEKQAAIQEWVDIVSTNSPL